MTAGYLPPHLCQQAAPVGGAACPGERCQHILLGCGSHGQYGKGHEQPAHHSDVGLAAFSTHAAATPVSAPDYAMSLPAARYKPEMACAGA